MDFTDEDKQRYSRHILLKGIGLEGQQKLADSKVLIIGAGGLGSPSVFYLAAAGVGTLGIADFDTVELSNLQRQVAHFTGDVGKMKAESAAEKALAINPGVEVKVYVDYIDFRNIREIIRGYDFVIDGTDNFTSKFLINDACVFEKKAFSHAGILGFEGQTMTVKPFESACYRCLFTAPPPDRTIMSCSQAGVLGPAVGVLGTIQATEALKYMTGAGNNLYNQLLVFDANGMDFRKVRFKKDPDCPVCGSNPSIKELKDSGRFVCESK